MNSGVALRSDSKEMASIMLPMLYQREALRRCGRRELEDVVGVKMMVNRERRRVGLVLDSVCRVQRFLFDR